MSLKRYPDGIQGAHFFQKDTPAAWPAWLRREAIRHERSKAPTNYVLADNRAALLYLVNQGSIDHNPWMSRIQHLDNPDFVLIDLDPQDCPFETIVEAAQLLHRYLERIGLEGYPKTTGGDGLHIYIPIQPVYTYEEVKSFAEVLFNLALRERPQLLTTPRSVSRRTPGRVYFDYLQNGKGKTVAAPYVLRAYPGAPVATPLAWREVKKGLHPSQFNIRDALGRFDKLGDLFKPVLAGRQRLEASLEKLEKLIAGGTAPSGRGSV